MSAATTSSSSGDLHSNAPAAAARDGYPDVTTEMMIEPIESGQSSGKQAGDFDNSRLEQSKIKSIDSDHLGRVESAIMSDEKLEEVAQVSKENNDHNEQNNRRHSQAHLRSSHQKQHHHHHCLHHHPHHHHHHHHRRDHNHHHSNNNSSDQQNNANENLEPSEELENQDPTENSSRVHHHHCSHNHHHNHHHHNHAGHHYHHHQSGHAHQSRQFKRRLMAQSGNNSQSGASDSLQGMSACDKGSQVENLINQASTSQQQQPSIVSQLNQIISGCSDPMVIGGDNELGHDKGPLSGINLEEKLNKRKGDGSTVENKPNNLDQQLGQVHVHGQHEHRHHAHQHHGHHHYHHHHHHRMHKKRLIQEAKNDNQSLSKDSAPAEANEDPNNKDNQNSNNKSETITADIENTNNDNNLEVNNANVKQLRRHHHHHHSHPHHHHSHPHHHPHHHHHHHHHHHRHQGASSSDNQTIVFNDRRQSLGAGKQSLNASADLDVNSKQDQITNGKQRRRHQHGHHHHHHNGHHRHQAAPCGHKHGTCGGARRKSSIAAASIGAGQVAGVSLGAGSVPGGDQPMIGSDHSSMSETRIENHFLSQANKDNCTKLEGATKTRESSNGPNEKMQQEETVDDDGIVQMDISPKAHASQTNKGKNIGVIIASANGQRAQHQLDQQKNTSASGSGVSTKQINEHKLGQANGSGDRGGSIILKQQQQQLPLGIGGSDAKASATATEERVSTDPSQSNINNDNGSACASGVSVDIMRGSRRSIQMQQQPMLQTSGPQWPQESQLSNNSNININNNDDNNNNNTNTTSGNNNDNATEIIHNNNSNSAGIRNDLSTFNDNGNLQNNGGDIAAGSAGPATSGGASASAEQAATSQSRYVPTSSQQQQQQPVIELSVPNERRRRLCWCCCCLCSSLIIRGKGADAKGHERHSKRHSETPLANRGFPAMPNVPIEEIRSWGDSFDKLMKNPDGKRVFHEFLRCEYSDENILFWDACEQFKKESNQRKMEEKAESIYTDYISILSPKEVSLDSRVRDEINKKIKHPTRDIFDEAQIQTYTLMARDSYPRFINSPSYKQLANLPTSSRKTSA